MEILRFHAFTDNYIWGLRHQGLLTLIDPGEARPILDHIAQSGDRLAAILLTHHHGDHVGGVEELCRLAPSSSPMPVFAPEVEAIPFTTHPLRGGEQIQLPGFAAEGSFKVYSVPGHTRGHLAYYRPGMLFCGDTLFTLGCGRLFEGSPQQMWQSLSTLAALPPDTQVYCAHEYTFMNLPFALAVEPGNRLLQTRSLKLKQKISENIPTVPDTLAEELATNVFLRLTVPKVVEAAQHFSGQSNLQDPVNVFAVLREWRNGFKPPLI